MYDDFIKPALLYVVPKPHSLNSPSYLKKKDYGQTPGYLLKRRQENIEQQEQEKAAERARKEEENKRFTAMSEDDRLKILAGLQAKWEKLNSDYQKLSLTVDTVPKINRKVSMENQLKVIEQDIEKFSQSKIFIKLVWNPSLFQ